jgi:AraC-like DNA-binding protein
MDCGFDNLGYFYRLFRRYTHSSPRRFQAAALPTTAVPSGSERQR